MEWIRDHEVFFSKPSYTATFIISIENEEYLDVDEWLICLHFNIEVNPLFLVEREEYDKDMVLMRTIYQRPQYFVDGCHYYVRPGYYKVQQLCPPSENSKVSKVLSMFVSSYQRTMRANVKERLPTILENPEHKVVAFSFDSESNDKAELEVHCPIERITIKDKCFYSGFEPDSIAPCESKRVMWMESEWCLVRWQRSLRGKIGCVGNFSFSG